MKQGVIFFILFTSLTFTFNAQIAKRVLFLGNSYTYVNNLPVIIAAIAQANGDSLKHDGNLIGGYTFLNHFTNGISKSKIALGNWDYVVLQAQSQEPSFSPSQVNSQTLPYAIKLDSLIKQAEACATTLFFETWGRKNGDAMNCQFYPPVCTYTGMQNRLRDSYLLFTDTTKGIMAPVGEAFRSSIAQQPALDLYSPDESHPSMEGSYLAAAVFYETIFHKSVISNTYNPGIASSTVIPFLQQVAHAIVTDSLSTWRLGKHVPYSSFTTNSITTSAWQFTPQFTTMNHLWRFGDGITSTLAATAHTYAATGTYTVQHVMFNACKRDSTSKVVNATVNSNVSVLERTVNWMNISPNPTRDACVLTTPVAGTLTITEATGRVVKRLSVYPGSNSIDLSELPSGLYIFSGMGATPKRIIIQR